MHERALRPAPGRRRRGRRRAGGGLAGARRDRARPDIAALIQDRLRRVAQGPYWRYPTMRLNQINWYAEVYSAAAEVTGDLSFLHRDMPRPAAGASSAAIRSPAPGTAGTLGPGMRFHYLPDGAPRSKLNTESAEYANIVASTNRFYDAAVARGMAPLPPDDEALLRRWMTRVLAGYWTHAGYLNWDTGFGFGRWHQMKKFGLAQQALIGIATGGRLSPSGNEAAWAKYILEAGFALYERKLPRADRRGAGPVLSVPRPPAVGRPRRSSPPRGWSPTPRAPSSAGIPARPRGRAAAAVRVRPGRRPARDHDAPLQHGDHGDHAGRVPVRRDRPRAALRRPPGGGRDARSARRPRASACWCATGAGTRRLVTARPASDRTAARRCASCGRRAASAAPGTPLRPFAGPFRVLRVTGTAPGAGVDARSTYTFRRSSILGEWTVHARTPAVRTAEALFPSTGGAPGGRLGDPARRHGRQARRPDHGPRGRRVLGPERALGLRRRADRPRQGRGGDDHQAEAASRPRPDPGPTLRSGSRTGCASGRCASPRGSSSRAISMPRGSPLAERRGRPTTSTAGWVEWRRSPRQGVWSGWSHEYARTSGTRHPSASLPSRS